MSQQEFIFFGVIIVAAIFVDCVWRVQDRRRAQNKEELFLDGTRRRKEGLKRPLVMQLWVPW